MDNNEKRGNAAVDEILAELKGKTPRDGTATLSVDAILAELGRPAKSSSAPVMPPPPRKAAPSAPSPAPDVAPVPPAPSKADAPAPSPVPQEPPQQPEPPAADTPPRAQKVINPNATIWDIETVPSQPLPRMGKAAALDKVEPGKYTGDTELLSWFGGGDNSATIPLSKREIKQAEKERKQQQAAERREEKRRQKQEDSFFFAAEDSPATEEEPFAGIEQEPPAVIEEEPAAAKESTFQPHAFEPDDAFDSIDAETATAPAPEEPAVPAADVPAQEPFFAKEAPHAPPLAPVPTPVPVPPPESPPPTPAPPESWAESTEATRAFGAGDGKKLLPFEALPDGTFSFDTVSLDDEAEDGFFQSQHPSTTAAIMSAIQQADVEAQLLHSAPSSTDDTEHDTLAFEPAAGEDGPRVPTAAYTQEFDSDGVPLPPETNKSLFVDEMVDDRFRDFFGETVIVDREEVKLSAPEKGRRKRKKSRSAILTGEFAKLAEQAERAERAEEESLETDDDFEDYNHLQDAEAIEDDIASLCTTLTRRMIASLVLGALLLYLGLGFAGALPLPDILVYANFPLWFAGAYLALVLAVIGVNFTTVATGLVGLVGEPTTDSAPALAALTALLQGVMLLVQAINGLPLRPATLFGGILALMLGFNALGKRVRAVSILRNFQLASAGHEHSAGYVLDNTTELAHKITKGLNEEYPTLLVSRPTALVKGFLRQSFSQRQADRRGRVLGWVVLGVGLAAAVYGWFTTQDLFFSLSLLCAAACICAPFSSSLVTGIPSLLMQKGASRVGAVVPGWSAIEELGEVNVVMATARDVFPPASVYLKGIKTFEKERIDLAILYAASVLTEGCDTLKDIFIEVIQGKNDMLYKVESLTCEQGRGFTAWVQNSRVVIGNREMLQRHDVDPPAIELEMKFVPKGCYPVYLAVSGKLFAMFIVGYRPDAEVQETLDGLVKSGVSLLIDSNDMNVSSELVEGVYGLPAGVVKVLGRRELDILEPLTEYLPESEGVMTHMGTFASFIGGMQAAAGCAAREKMSSVVQIASVVLAALLCGLLAFSEGLAGLSVLIVLLYQLGWTVLVSALPFALRY